ncbi:Uncharacterized protein FKW44_021137, partial [Caligus rogercresseyi]
IKLRHGLPSLKPPPSSWPKSSAPFSFSFASAGKIAKVVKAMRATEALGVDGIPVSVLKKGIEVLAGPISHLVNRSLASGTVPTALKLSNVYPFIRARASLLLILHHTDPSASCRHSPRYRDRRKDRLRDPSGQDGGSSEHPVRIQEGPLDHNCVGHCPCKVVESQQRGKVVGVLGFDLSAAFDTVDQLQLLPKLKKLGIEGMQLEWFKSYLSGGSQRVVWNGAESDFLNVKYGVRQGSILGPILYLVLVADVTSCVGIGDEENSSYADDFFLWAVGDSLEEVGLLLETKADAFSKYAGGMVSQEKDTSAFTIRVGGVELHPSDEIEFLGVKFDSDFTTAPHNAYVVKAAKQRAALISRKIPSATGQGAYVGKLSYAAAVVTTPRFDNKEPDAAHRAVQVAINDVARSIAGCRRRDHIRIEDLLSIAKIPSLNEITVMAVAVETWKCFHSNDGGCGARNPIGDLVFPTPKRPTRSTTSVACPLRGGTDTFASHAVSVWNNFESLRSARTLAAARDVARTIGRSTPI